MKISEELEMSKYILTAIVIVLFSYGISYGQCDHSIFAAYQDDLPITGDPYNPCGNLFSYDFEFDVVKFTNIFNTATIYPQVISSDLNLSVNSWRWSPGTDYHKTGKDIFTGSGQDFLQIGIWSGSEPDVFENMDWSVHYYNDNPD
jgi:hypothetical protein